MLRPATLLFSERLQTADIVPLLAFAAGSILAAAASVGFAVGVIDAIVSGDAILLTVCGILACVFVWLTRIAIRPVLDAGPRSLGFDEVSDSYIVSNWGYRRAIPAVKIRQTQIVAHVKRGGHKSGSGIWLYLLFDLTNTKPRKFYLYRAMSLRRDDRARVRELLARITDAGRVPDAGLRVVEI